MKRAFLLFTLLTTFNNNIIGYCDIKGNVNNPGVYEVRNNETINDVITIHRTKELKFIIKDFSKVIFCNLL